MFQLFNGGRVKKLKAGDPVVYKGYPVLSLFHINSGYISVMDKDSIVYIYSAGDVLPLSTFLRGSCRTRYDYQCLRDAEVSVVSAQQARKNMLNHISLGENVLEYTDRIHREMLRRISMLHLIDPWQRFTATLTFLSERSLSPESSQVPLSLSLDELRSLTNLSRSKLSRYLQMLGGSIKPKNESGIRISTEKMSSHLST